MDYNDSLAYSQIGAAAIQTAGSILNSQFNYQHTRELAEYQNEMNRENWRMQNEYNTPANQVKRLEEAGINPVLAYQNSADASSASPMQPAQVGKPFSLDMNVLGNAMNSVFDALVKKKELQMLDKQIDAQEIKNRIGVFGLKKSALDYIFNYDSAPDEKGVDVLGLAGGIPDTIAVDYGSLGYQKSFNQILNLVSALNLLNSRNSLTQEQIDYYKKLGLKVDAETDLINSKTIGQGYENDINEVNASLAEVAKILGISEKGVNVLKVILKFLR